ncbi:MAG: BatA domain-containing protein [Planctomycetaceae bacterium]
MLELLAQGFAVAGAALAGIPFLLHMLRRVPAQRLPFSLVRFLPASLPRTTRRATPQHWPLMLLRMLAIALIALAFARPFQRLSMLKPDNSGPARRVAVLLDRSASMRRDGLREKLIAELQQVAAELQPADVLSVAQFSQGLQPLISAEEWRQTASESRELLISRACESWEPDWRGTASGPALLETATELSGQTSGIASESERVVVLITDFQEGSDLAALRNDTWPDNVRLDLRIVQPEQPGNAGLSLLEDQKTGRIRVRLTASGDAPASQYGLQIFDTAGKPLGDLISADVAPGQRRTITLPDLPADQPRPAGVELAGDPHPFDNVADLPLNAPLTRRIAHAGSLDVNDAESMRYYLQRVVDGNEAEPLEVTDLLTADGQALPATPEMRLAVVTSSIPKNLAVQLRELADSGGIVLAALNSTAMAESLQPLFPEGLNCTEAAVSDYAILTAPDLTAPWLAPFAAAQFGDFSSIRFWHYRQLTHAAATAPWKVLARMDTGDPAILQFPANNGGAIYVLAAGWQPADSQLALSSRFPPLLLRLVQLAWPRQAGSQVFEAGTRVNPGTLAGSDTWTLNRPDGTPVNPADTAASAASGERAQSVELDTPGRWMLTGQTPNGPVSTSLLVTVSAAESRTEPLPAGQLQALGLPAELAEIRGGAAPRNDAQNATQQDSAELESRQKLWRWFILAGLCCLVLESSLAAFLERREQALQEA